MFEYLKGPIKLIYWAPHTQICDCNPAERQGKSHLLNCMTSARQNTYIRNELLPVWREIGMGFFLYEWRSHEYRKKNFLTNHEWLSRRDEIKIPHARRSRKWGIFILSQLLSHDVMSEEIYPSLFLSRPGVTFPFLRGKFHHIFFIFY